MGVCLQKLDVTKFLQMEDGAVLVNIKHFLQKFIIRLVVISNVDF